MFACAASGALTCIKRRRRGDIKNELAQQANIASMLHSSLRTDQHPSVDSAVLHALLELAPDGIFAADGDGRCTYVNAAGCALLGHAPHEIIGRTPFDFLTREEGARLRRSRSTTPGGGIETGEWMLRRKNGTCVPVEIRASQLPGGGWQTFVRDISARRTQEAERRALFDEIERERRQLKAMLDAFPLGMLVFGADRRLSANQRAEELLGTKLLPDGGLAEYAKLLFHPDGRAVPASELVCARVLHERRPILGAEYLVRRPDGSELPLLISAAPMRDAEGNVIGAVGVLQDISERVNLERAVREKERRFQAVFDLLPVGLWIADGQGRIVLGNQAGRDIWQGIRHVGPEQFGEYEGWWVDSGLPIAPDEWGIARAIGRGETSRSELIRIRCFDGSYKTVINWAAPIRDDAGLITGAVAVNEDVTALYQTQEQLRAAVRDREHILAVVSHDLRSPIAAIGLRAALAEQKATALPGGDELRGVAAAIREIARGMYGLVNDLLAISTGRPGRSLLDCRPIAPAVMLSRAAEVAQPLLAHAGLQLVVEPPGELPLIHVDVDRVMRVFANLLDNASKFTARGGRVELRATSASGAVLFTVANSGSPLRKEQMERLFLPFWQGLPKDSRGAGLGLSICRAIIEAHGGSVWAEAAEGMRVKICVLLPCARPGVGAGTTT